jgi:predicted MPP superfamily phosphohydrolase
MGSAARFAVFLAIVLAIWGLQHLYVGWRLLALPPLNGTVAGRWVLFGLVAGFVTYPLGRTLFAMGLRGIGRALEYVGAVWMGTLFLLLAALLIAEVLTAFGYAPAGWTVPIRWTAVGLALVAAVTGWIGGLSPPRLVEHEIFMPGLPPDADGTVVALVSDVHLGTLLGRRWLAATLEVVERAQPDLIAVAGDLIDADAGVVEELVPELRRLAAPLGTWATLGNHEHYAGPDRSRRLLADADFTVLDNAAVEVRPGLWIAGVPDVRGAEQTGSAVQADLGAALGSVPPGDVCVLLLHSPDADMVDKAAAEGCDLILSGHTHGGQLQPFGLLVRLAYPHTAGVTRVGNASHVVSRGAGHWGPPMRLGAPAEVWRITLRSGGQE